MEIEKWIVSATRTLVTADIETARLDSLVLAESVLSKDRSWLLAHPTDMISENDVKKLNKYIAQRCTHYPLAYLTHNAYFYDVQLFVNDQVLVPRPESETIIDILRTLPRTDITTIIDIGTGSGALAISAKLLYPDSMVIALDVDPKCLRVAKKNAISTKTDISFFRSDLLGSVPSNLIEKAVLLANLPYVPDNFSINKSARLEPKNAIFGGANGLDLYSRLFEQITNLASKPSYVITESFPDQHDGLQFIANQAGYKYQATDDFIQLFSLRR